MLKNEIPNNLFIQIYDIKYVFLSFSGSLTYMEEQLCEPMYAREQGQLDPIDKLVCNQSFGIGSWPPFKHDDK